jgi:hypothetical protein
MDRDKEATSVEMESLYIQILSTNKARAASPYRSAQRAASRVEVTKKCCSSMKIPSESATAPQSIGNRPLADILPERSWDNVAEIRPSSSSASRRSGGILALICPHLRSRYLRYQCLEFHRRAKGGTLSAFPCRIAYFISSRASS